MNARNSNDGAGRPTPGIATNPSMTKAQVNLNGHILEVVLPPGSSTTTTTTTTQCTISTATSTAALAQNYNDSLLLAMVATGECKLCYDENDHNDSDYEESGGRSRFSSNRACSRPCSSQAQYITITHNYHGDDDDLLQLEQRRIRVTRRMRTLTCFAAIGGFLSGYNTGVISGALLPLQRVFSLTPGQEEAIVSAEILLAFMGASIFGSCINTRLGRRKTIYLAAAVFTLGGLWLGLAQSYGMILTGQILLGIGIGIESLTSPMYISEMAPVSQRGMLVSAYALMMCYGQFAAGVCDGIFATLSPTHGWRAMFAMAAVPGLVMMYGFGFLAPESPTWLVTVGRYDEARCVLESVRESDHVAAQEVDAILHSMRSKKADQYLQQCESVVTDYSACEDEERGETWSLLQRGDSGYGSLSSPSPPPVHSRKHFEHDSGTTSSPSMDAKTWAMLWDMLVADAAMRRALAVGTSLMMLQQFCGANVVMYYSATIYRMSGFAELTAIWLSTFTALAQLVGLGLSVLWVERAGRRPLVLGSFTGVSLCLVGLGFSFYLARVMSEPIIVPSSMSTAATTITTGRSLVENTHPSFLFASDDECMKQPALVWDGVSRYCYDCAMIPGCGFCGGVCVKGSPMGPENPMQCPTGSDWNYDLCEAPAVLGYMPVLFMVLYLIVFGIGAAGLPWTINSEIYPVQYRTLAVSVSTGVNWLCNLVISSTFLTISDASVLTLPGSFFLYSCISSAGVVWLYWALPETKGLSVSEIQQAFAPQVRSSFMVAEKQHGSSSNMSVTSTMATDSSSATASVARTSSVE